MALKKMYGVPQDEEMYFRIAGNWVARKLLPLPISANQLTYFRIFVTIGGVYSLLWNPTPLNCFYAAVLMHLMSILDFADGALARYRGTTSVFGAWSENVMDSIFCGGSTLYALVVAVGVYQYSNAPIVLLLPFFTVFGKYANQIIVSANAERSDRQVDSDTDESSSQSEYSGLSQKYKRLYNFVFMAFQWDDQIILYAALLTFTLNWLPIHPLFWGLLLQALINQIPWTVRLLIELKYFYKTDFR